MYIHQFPTCYVQDFYPFFYPPIPSQILLQLVNIIIQQTVNYLKIYSDLDQLSLYHSPTFPFNNKHPIRNDIQSLLRQNHIYSLTSIIPSLCHLEQQYFSSPSSTAMSLPPPLILLYMLTCPSIYHYAYKLNHFHIQSSYAKDDCQSIPNIFFTIFVHQSLQFILDSMLSCSLSH